MKVLQLFNNWKWTGPAEYACNLAQSLQEQGVATAFACGRPPQGETEHIVSIARERGLQPAAGFHLSKHVSLRKNLADLPRLKRFITQEGFTVVHTHLTNGHLLAALASRKLSSPPIVIRTCYEGEKTGFRDQLLYRNGTDGLIVSSPAAHKAILQAGYLSEERICFIPPGIDTDRFDPGTVMNHNRAEWGIAPEAPVVGIVARVQTHRRFDVLLTAIAEAVKTISDLKVMVIGRGTKIQELAIDPARAMGISDHFIFTGYRKEDYVETLNCIDIKVFLVPGSDGSCRAVREAMALGKPVIAARRGMLPEMVDHNVNGMVIEDTAPNLAQAIITLVKDQTKRKQMGLNARQKAHAQFSLKTQTKHAIRFYETVTALRKRTC